MPPRGNLAEAREFAQLHGGWIAARLGRLPKAAPFQSGTVVPLRGIPHRIVIGERGLKEGSLEYQGRRDAAATPVALAEMVDFVRGKLQA